MAEQELAQYKTHYTLLEKELAELKAKPPKLTSFKRTKFQGKDHEDFEEFITWFEAKKVLNANGVTGWTNKQKTSFLISALEGKALEVVRASITTHTLNTFNKHTTALYHTYCDTSAGERALTRLQKLTQTGSVETYIREFNTLLGLASKVATLDTNATLRGFLRGLRDKMKLGVAAMDPADLAVAQKSARALDLILNNKDGNKPETMDTSVGQKKSSRAPATGAVIVATSSVSAGKRSQASPNVKGSQNNRKRRTLSMPSALDAVVRDTVSKIVECV
jgi:hypothetical protein